MTAATIRGSATCAHVWSTEDATMTARCRRYGRRYGRTRNRARLRHPLCRIPRSCRVGARTGPRVFEPRGRGRGPPVTASASCTSRSTSRAAHHRAAPAPSWRAGPVASRASAPSGRSSAIASPRSCQLLQRKSVIDRPHLDRHGSVCRNQTALLEMRRRSRGLRPPRPRASAPAPLSMQRRGDPVPPHTWLAISPNRCGICTCHPPLGMRRKVGDAGATRASQPCDGFRAAWPRSNTFRVQTSCN